ncbi:MAG: UMP kinase [Lachnospiraceae bacterium]|nr:UMP kinase [Lachnospiraceae bacterium]MBR5760787.1 UMP kinase [Lachnospiraceae bacterium]
MRIILKLSGEALAGDKKTGFDEETVRGVARQIKQIAGKNEIAIVIGGGNFWRGRTSEAIDRVKADQIGMLATVMNCLYVSEIFRSEGMDTEIMTPFICSTFTKQFSKDEAVKALKAGKVVFFAGGTGHPYFSTDMGIVLKAVEIEAEAVLLAKSIDGVYDDDPAKNPGAKKFDEISLEELVKRGLKVVDTTASALALENKVPFLVFDLNEENSIVNALSGKFNGTKVTA